MVRLPSIYGLRAILGRVEMGLGRLVAGRASQMFGACVYIIVC